MDDLYRITPARTKRCSSYDVTGGNADRWMLAPGETRVLADISGPGKITHIWMTQSNPDPDYLRRIVLRMYWDGEEQPSVLAPLGDFFCLGHSMVCSFQSLPFTASVNDRQHNCFGGAAALNCYLPMPFNRSARVEVTNETDENHYQYFYIDYELQDAPFGADAAYFHAQFHRENPTTGWGHEVTVNSAVSDGVKCLSDKDNYQLLSAEGAGQFIGFNLSVTNLQRRVKNPHERTWWGEGDEMIFIDGEPWPPSLHGTGSEDALNQAYGMQRNAYLCNGSSIYEADTLGYQTSYVFYLANPVRFTKSLRASIEHGHGNHLSNEYSSVAYWYQREPHKAFGILPTLQRLPLVRSFAAREGTNTPPVPMALTPEMEAAKQLWAQMYLSRKEKGSY